MEKRKIRLDHSSLHDTKQILEHTEESEREFAHHQQVDQLKQLFLREEAIKKDLTFWNSMADGKLQTITGCVNLFILLLMITLGGATFNGANTDGPYVLGWICVSQVCFFYLVIAYVKCRHIPLLECRLQQIDTKGFKIYQQAQSGKKEIKKLGLGQLEILYEVVTQRAGQFSKCFQTVLAEGVIKDIKSTLAERSTIPYQVNQELKGIKQRQKQAKKWQQFWQNFVLGKSITMPGVLLLVFIITPLSIATRDRTSISMNNAQGWLALGFWGAGIVLFIIIKAFLWDKLNDNVEKVKSSPFLAIYPVIIGHKNLKDLTTNQLEQIQKMLIKRQSEFHLCFPEQDASNVLSHVKAQLAERLPKKKGEQQQYEINQIIKQEKEMQSYLTAWTSFFNQRLISSIISALKFWIVVAITFVPNKSLTKEQLQDSRIGVGSIGIVFFVFGYLFYVFLKVYYLNYLEEKTHQKRSSPFTIFRQVYFGEKSLENLEVHELEDLNIGLNTRKDQFLKCFPKINIEALDDEIYGILKEKINRHDQIDNVFNLLNIESKQRKALAFWSGYVDNQLMTSMYSIYVLLVLLIETLTSIHDGVNKPIIGWIGLAVVSLLIVTFLFFKFYWLEYLGNSLKALKIDGYSEYNLVYTKSKELKDVQLPELQKIQKIIEINPIQFRRCFPQSQCSTTLREVKALIAEKEQFEKHKRVLNGEEQVRCQLFRLNMNRCKSALASWNSLVFDKLFVITPIAIVIFILWSQSIAITYYGINVCGFLTVAELAIIAFLVAFHLCYYRAYLQGKIRTYERHLKFLEIRDFHNVCQLQIHD